MRREGEAGRVGHVLFYFIFILLYLGKQTLTHIELSSMVTQ